jgi:hypothetical protein
MITNTLMPKFLFGLRCTKRSWVAYCKHHLHVVTTKLQAFDLRWHQGLYTGVEKIGVTCLQPGSDSLPHVSVCCKSPASQVLLKEPDGIEITGPHAANWTWKWSGTAAVRLWTMLPTVPNSRSMIFYSLDPQRSTWPARNLRHTPSYSKLSPPTHSHLIPIALCRDTKPTWRKKILKCQWWLLGSLMCTICYPCAIYMSKSE